MAEDRWVTTDPLLTDLMKDIAVRCMYADILHISRIMDNNFQFMTKEMYNITAKIKRLEDLLSRLLKKVHGDLSPAPNVKQKKYRKKEGDD